MTTKADNASGTAQSHPHLAALDGMRGVAALWVVIFHVPWASHLGRLALLRNGYLAVDLFFILSGFVIARAYGHRLRDGDEVAVFLWRRFFRLYPVHIAALAALVGLEVLKLVLAQRGLVSAVPPFTGPNTVPALAANLVLAQGWLGLPGTTWNAPAWSTSVEVAAYGLFALAAWSGLTRRTPILVAVALLGLGEDALLAIAWGTLDLPGLPGLLRGLGGFGVGVLIERLSASNRISGRIADAQLPLVAGFLAIAATGGAFLALAPVLFALLVASLHAEAGSLQRPLSAPLAQTLGRISYPLYLLHFPIFLTTDIVVKRLIGPGLAEDPWLGDALVVGLLGLLGVFSWAVHRYIEEPARRFGARNPPLRFGGRPRAPAQAAA